jgi:hypothetical protein
MEGEGTTMASGSVVCRMTIAIIAMSAILGGIIEDTRFKVELLHRTDSSQSRKPLTVSVSWFVFAPLRILLE